MPRRLQQFRKWMVKNCTFKFAKCDVSEFNSRVMCFGGASSESTAETLALPASAAAMLEPDWVSDWATHTQQAVVQDLIVQQQERRAKLEEHLLRVRGNQANLMTKAAPIGSKRYRDPKIAGSRPGKASHVTASPAAAAASPAPALDSDDMALLVDWSDEMDPAPWRAAPADSDSDTESASTTTQHAAGGDADTPNFDDYRETPQIIFCSRTHSQLTQFVNEIKRTAFADTVRVVSLSSRKNLCVHPEISKLKNAQRINDKCLDMQKSAGKKKTAAELAAEVLQGTVRDTPASAVHSSCPYLSNDSMSLFRDRILSRVHDLEELHTLGSGSGICSYFGARHAVAAAHVVTMPYASLLHQATRESLGVRLQGAVVIIDEAHNLIESINDVHGVKVTLRELQRSHSQLSQYLEKYQARLKRCNQVNIRQILGILQSCMQYLAQKPTTDAVPSARAPSPVTKFGAASSAPPTSHPVATRIPTLAPARFVIAGDSGVADVPRGLGGSGNNTVARTLLPAAGVGTNRGNVGASSATETTNAVGYCSFIFAFYFNN